MLLAELGHGKLVNLGKEIVEHQFVNTTLLRGDRIRFAVQGGVWNRRVPGAERFREVLTAVLSDWGTGLDLQLYQEALLHLLWGEGQLPSEIEVGTPEHSLGRQSMPMAAPRIAFALTALPGADADYESHLRRFRRFTELEAILCVNISLGLVTFNCVI
jgi:hypothetical protein